MSDLNIIIDGRDDGGQPLVLVHSGVADHRMWDGVAAALASEFIVIRYDLRGFGASPAPTESFRHRDDLAAVLDAAGVVAATVAGNSLGGAIALDFATTWPHRVSHLAVLAAPAPAHHWSATVSDYADAESAALDAGDLDEAVRLNQDMWVRGPNRDWTPGLRALSDAVEPAMRVALMNQTVTEEHELDDDPPFTDRLDRLAAPLTIGVGDADVRDFADIAQGLCAAVPSARLVDFSGSGHLIPVERPGEVAALISDQHHRSRP